MYDEIRRTKHWRWLLGLPIALVLLSLTLSDNYWNSDAAGTENATDAYYTFKPGESLEGVALRFGLTIRTLRCANPAYRVGDVSINLPLTAARRHRVLPGQSLGEIAAYYGVELSVITQFPLNYWQGCAGTEGFGPEEAAIHLPIGTLLYVPIPPLSQSFSKNGANLASFQSQRQNQNQNEVIISSPVPLVTVPVSLATATATLATPPQALSSTRIAAPASPTSRPSPTALPKSAGANGGPIIWPLRGVITTPFSASHPAIDIATAVGTPVLAAQAGLVYFSGWSPYGYGNFVEIEHGDGRQTHYAHLRQFTVKYGDFVQQGQIIGYEGSTGNSSGPHLHFEVVVQGRYVDPLQHLSK